MPKLVKVCAVCDEGLDYRAVTSWHRRCRPAQLSACERCAAPMPAKLRSGKRRRYCSRECAGCAPVQGSPCRLCGVSCRGVYCSKACQNAASVTSGRKWLGVAAARRVWFRECPVCLELFAARTVNGRYCSKSCRWVAAGGDRELSLYRTAQLLGVAGREWRRNLYRWLGERDGYSCAVCLEPVDVELPSGWRNPIGPSVEHLEPWSETFDSSPANLGVSHFECNLARLAKPLEEVWR